MNTNFQSNYSAAQTTTQTNPDHLVLRLRGLEENTQLQESTALYCSLIDQEANELEHSSLQSLNQENVLIHQFNNLREAAETLKLAMKFINTEGTTIGATGITISTGLMNLLHGNFLTGIPVTFMGLNELRKIIQRYNKITDAGGLIGEARTGIAMIKQLEEFQIQNLNSITAQLKNADEQLNEAQAQLAQINQLSVQGSADAEAKKQEAYKLTEKAINDQLQSIYTLELGKTNIQNALQSLKTIANQLESLMAFAKDRKASPDDINTFILSIQEILAQLHTAQAGIVTAVNSSTEGLGILRDSIKTYGLALEKYNEAVQVMQNTLYETQKKAQMNQISKAKSELEKARNEVAIVKERAETNKEIAEHAEKKLSQLQEQVDSQFGTTSMLFGAAVGTAAISFVSPLFVMPFVAIGTASAHYLRRVSGLFAKHSESLDTKNVGNTFGSVKARYNGNSTGWGGSIRDLALKIAKKEVVGSRTEGVIGINLRDGSPYIYGYNRNSKSDLGMMHDDDIRKLDADLRELLKNNKITAKECLQILESLAQVESEYGMLCLITPGCLFLRDLISECQRS
jgi:hypothetical protein